MLFALMFAILLIAIAAVRFGGSRFTRVAWCLLAVAMATALLGPAAHATGVSSFSSQKTVFRQRVQRQPIFQRSRSVVVNKQVVQAAPAPVVFEQQFRAVQAPVYAPAPVFVPQFAPAYSYGFQSFQAVGGGCH